jgi:hypothetical protein
MSGHSFRAIVTVLAIANPSVGNAQVFDQTPVYEALFAQVDRLGFDRTYFVGESESPDLGRSTLFDIPEGFRVRDESATHAVEDFGDLSVFLVDASFLDGLWDASCRDGWSTFHQRFPDAGDLTRVSHVAFNEFGDKASVYIELGRGCRNLWFSTYHLEMQDSQWVVTGRSKGGGA